MKTFFISLFLCSILSAPPVSAGVFRLKIGNPLENKYVIENVTNSYDVSGTALGLDYFPSSGMGGFYNAGYGFQFSNNSAEDDSIENSILFPRSFNYKNYQAHYILGFPISSFQIEVPLTLTRLKKTSGMHKGDKKYGYGYGVQLHYRFYANFSLVVSYENQTYTKGKNASTGEDGSLAYPINISSKRFYLAYFFSFGGAGGATESAPSGGGESAE